VPQPEGTLIFQLFEGYQGEGIDMPYTMADFRRDFAKAHLKDLTPAERLEGISPEQRLEGLAPEEIERYLEKLKAQRSPRPRRPRRNK
jgi:hypothetical protein